MSDGVVRPPVWHATAAILKDILARLPHAGRLQEYRVWQVWEAVVGKDVAREAQPLRIQDGKLFVIVSHPACVQELQFAKARIKAQLNQKLGKAIVKGIFFVVGDIGRAVAWPTPPLSRSLPPFTELAIPALGNPRVENALAAVLSARRRRLVEDALRDCDDAQKRG